MPNVQNPRGWSDRFFAAQARAAGDAVREHNDRLRNAHTRKIDLGHMLAAGEIGQDDYDIALLEIDEILATPEPGSEIEDAGNDESDGSGDKPPANPGADKPPETPAAEKPSTASATTGAPAEVTVTRAAEKDAAAAGKTGGKARDKDK